MKQQLPPLNEQEILADVEHILIAHNTASDHTRSVMADRTMAMCLAETIFDSLFYLGNQHYPEIDQRDLDYLLSKEPSLAEFEWTGFYEFKQGDPMAGTLSQMLHAEEQATVNLADWIQSDAELALCCWNLAQQIADAPTCHWNEEDFAYDCLVVLGLRPMYEFFQHPQGTFELTDKEVSR